MQAFLEYVVKGLVQNPDAVIVTPVTQDGMTVYELRVDPQDVGKVIGKQGITINAIRSLLLAGSAKKGERCTWRSLKTSRRTEAAGCLARSRGLDASGSLDSSK